MPRVPFVLALAGALAAVPRASAAAPGDHPLLYEYEKPRPGDCDVIKLDSGVMHVGKVLEWATDVFVFDAAGRRHTFDLAHVSTIQIGRGHDPSARPALPDLTVAFVEHVGSATRPTGLKVHILNAGGGPAEPFDYRISVDQKVVASGRVAEAVPAGADRTVDVELAGAPDESGELSVEIHAPNAGAEIVRWNNRFVEPLRAVPIKIVVGGELREAFRSTRNLVDSYCVEDWLQYHVRMMNALLRRSAYASAPQGATLRLRIQSIVTGAGGGDRPPGGLRIDLSSIVPGDAARAAARVDWSLCRQIGRELGLVDLARFEAPVEQCMVRNIVGDFVQRAYRLPGQPLLMRGPAAGIFSELDVLHLNRRSGDMASRPEYLSALPTESALVVLGPAGRPVAGVDVAIFQRSAGEGEALRIPNEPIVIGETDAQGRLPLPARDAGAGRSPNPFGAVAPDGSNGLFLVRLRKGGFEEYHFVSILDFALAAARDPAAPYNHPIPTLLSMGGPEPPRMLRVRYDEDAAANRRCYVQWPAAKGGDVSEYRIYARESRSTPGWALVGVDPQDRVGAGGFASVPIGIQPIRSLEPSAGTEFAVAGIGPQGDSGVPTAPRYLPSGRAESVSLAVVPESNPATIFFSLVGPLNNGVIKSNIGQAHEDYGIRTSRFPGYEPWGGGMAFDERKRLVMTDPHNHQVGWYDQGELVLLAGKPDRGPAAASSQPAEFDTPSDVAVDDRGRVYVADTGNNRVQELNGRGQFVRLLEVPDATPEDALVAPTGLGYAFGRLCVVDQQGRRIQVFDVSGPAPKRVRVIRKIFATNRALCSASGRVYVIGRDDSDTDAFIVYPPEPVVESNIDQPERVMRRLVNGIVRGPCGLYADSGGTAYFVTAFPFVVHKFVLE